MNRVNYVVLFGVAFDVFIFLVAGVFLIFFKGRQMEGLAIFFLNIIC